MRTAVVILNWNTRDYLEKFLPLLISSMKDGEEVIVADSCSTDGSMDMLAEKFPSVKQIKLDNNYGFTGGYNRAFEAVCNLPEAIDLEYFVLINSDIEVSDGWLQPLTEWMDSHPDCSACGPKIHSWYNRDEFEYAGAAGGMLDRLGYPFCLGRVMGRIEKDNGQYDNVSDVFWASGACLLVRKTDFSQMKGLDDRFFAHMEEIDLCWRLQLEGKKVCVVPQSTVWHIGGGTLPKESPWKLKLNFRNNLLMLEKNLAKTYSLQEMKSGVEPKKAASKGLKRARRTILRRKILDGCSAAVYLLTGKFSFFKAVLTAHKECGSLLSPIKLVDIQEYSETHKGVNPPFLFPEWIVWSSLKMKEMVFEHIRTKL